MTACGTINKQKDGGYKLLNVGNIIRRGFMSVLLRVMSHVGSNCATIKFLSEFTKIFMLPL
jgi:hypothetical protein